jgi:undecaprenyl-diphosphatase
VRADLRRGLIGAAGLMVSALPVRGSRVSALETRAFRVVNRLPDAAYPAVWPVMQFGALAAVPAAAGAALLAGRRALGVQLAVAGGGAWTAAKVVKRLRVRGRPASLLADVNVRGAEATGGGFVSGHAAVAAALAATAAPLLGRRGRALRLMAPVVALSRLYVGAHLPLDALGGASLGLLIESAVSSVTRGRGDRATA